MEHHIHIICDGKTIQIDGLPESLSEKNLPDYYVRGLQMIYSFIEARIRSVSCVCISGIWFCGSIPAVAAFDIWLQAGEDGFFLPMSTAARLFSDNGIPYFHTPFMS